MLEPLSAEEIHAMLVFVLTGGVGKTADHWSALIKIEVRNIVFNAEGNWRVNASGTEFERNVIAESAGLLVEQYPYAYA